MKQQQQRLFFPAQSSFLLLALLLCASYLDGSAAKTYSIGARSLTDCPKGTPPSACAKKYLMFPFPRVGRGFPRSQRVIGMLKQPRIGRSDSSLLQQPDGLQRIYDADDQSEPAVHLDYQRRAPDERDDHRRTYLDNYSAARRSLSPWPFFLISPINFHSISSGEHALDHIIPAQLDYKLIDDSNEE